MACSLDSRELGELIVNVLSKAHLIDEESIALATDIAEEEIEVRKALGDYGPAVPNQISNLDLAGLIVDAMCVAKVIAEGVSDHAVDIAVAQLDLRRTLGNV